jgi:predicted DNA-binding transcriptional regulator AlpA
MTLGRCLGWRGGKPIQAAAHDPVPRDPQTVEALRDHPAGGPPASLAAAIEPLLLTADQAAALVGVSPATWYRFAAGGRCSASIRLTRGCVRWQRESLVEWIRLGCPPRKEFEARRAAQQARR